MVEDARGFVYIRAVAEVDVDFETAHRVAGIIRNRLHHDIGVVDCDIAVVESLYTGGLEVHFIDFADIVFDFYDIADFEWGFKENEDAGDVIFDDVFEAVAQAEECDRDEDAHVEADGFEGEGNADDDGKTATDFFEEVDGGFLLGVIGFHFFEFGTDPADDEICRDDDDGGFEDLNEFREDSHAQIAELESTTGG